MIKKSLLAFIPFFVCFSFLPNCNNLSFTDKDGGIYRSQDRGENWQQMTVDEDQPPLVSLDILSIAVDPEDPDVVYVGTDGSGLYKSCCNGEYWRKVKDENNILSPKAKVHDIEIDPKNPERVYLAVYQSGKGRVFRSQNGGKSWREVYVVSEKKNSVFEVEVDSYENSIVYIGIEEGGLLKSEDYGVSWKTLKWFKGNISDIAINPKDTRVVYISTFSEGIYKTKNKGSTWQSFEEQLEDFRQGEKVRHVVIDSNRPNIVYSASKYGLLVSENGGGNWKEVDIIMPKGTQDVLSMALDPKNTNIIYYGAGSNLYKSKDKGKHWTVSDLNSGRDVKVIAIDSNNPKTVYVGMYE